jgi:hypothetical protein
MDFLNYGFLHGTLFHKIYLEVNFMFFEEPVVSFQNKKNGERRMNEKDGLLLHDNGLFCNG